jgi:hypothetical protein
MLAEKNPAWFKEMPLLFASWVVAADSEKRVNRGV